MIFSSAEQPQRVLRCAFPDIVRTRGPASRPLLVLYTKLRACGNVGSGSYPQSRIQFGFRARVVAWRLGERGVGRTAPGHGSRYTHALALTLAQGSQRPAMARASLSESPTTSPETNSILAFARSRSVSRVEGLGRARVAWARGLPDPGRTQRKRRSEVERRGLLARRSMFVVRFCVPSKQLRSSGRVHLVSR